MDNARVFLIANGLKESVVSHLQEQLNEQFPGIKRIEFNSDTTQLVKTLSKIFDDNNKNSIVLPDERSIVVYMDNGANDTNAPIPELLAGKLKKLHPHSGLVVVSNRSEKAITDKIADWKKAGLALTAHMLSLSTPQDIGDAIREMEITLQPKPGQEQQPEEQSATPTHSVHPIGNVLNSHSNGVAAGH